MLNTEHLIFANDRSDVVKSHQTANLHVPIYLYRSTSLVLNDTKFVLKYNRGSIQMQKKYFASVILYFGSRDITVAMWCHLLAGNAAIVFQCIVDY